jgi:hypothetical protein
MALNIPKKERFFIIYYLKILSGHSNSEVPSVTITIKVAVYSPAERAKAVRHELEISNAGR